MKGTNRQKLNEEQKKLSFRFLSGNFFVSAFILILLVANGVLYTAVSLYAQVPSADTVVQIDDSSGTSRLPQECLDAGITDDEECKRFIDQRDSDNSNDSNDSADDSDSVDNASDNDSVRDEQELDESDRQGDNDDEDDDNDDGNVDEPKRLRDSSVNACGQDCGLCRICRGSSCVRAPFGTPDPRCLDRQVCDGLGRCVEVRKSGDLSEENRRLFEEERNDEQDENDDDTEDGQNGDDHEGSDDGLRAECLRHGLTTKEGCLDYLRKKDHAPRGNFSVLLPEVCRLEEITEPAACIVYLKEQASVVGRSGREEFDASVFGDRDVSSAKRFGPQGEFTGPDFDEFFPQECRDADITDRKECQRLLFSLNMPGVCRNNADIETPEDCERFLSQRRDEPECDDENSDECDRTIIRKHLPDECLEAGVDSAEDCEELLDTDFRPKICRQQGAENDQQCARIIFTAYGTPRGCENVDALECKRRIQEGEIDDDEFEGRLRDQLSDHCRELGATSFEECERLARERNLPAECREAGAFTRKACERVMMEKYDDDPDEFPKVCREADAQTPQDCRLIVAAQHMPNECRRAEITDPKECREFIAKKDFPPECIEADALDRESCEQIMRDKYLAPLCKEQGVNDEEACRELMKKTYAEKFQCDGDISAQECALAIRKRHLGQIVKLQEETKQIRENIKLIVGRHLALGRRGLTPGRDGADVPGPPEEVPPLNEVQEQEILDILPVKPDVNAAVLVFSSDEVNTITEDENIISTLPAAITFDDDQDGLPNDLEQRLGSDPNNPDTDGDGFLDGEEVKNGFSPTGEGTLNYDLSPGEQALVNDATFEQPIDSGQEEDEFEISEQEDQDSDQTSRLIRPAFAQGNSPIRLRGRATPNTAVTLFIYSEVPIIGSTVTDASGAWVYDIEKSLTDGEHTAYVATTDSRGNIIKKSAPFSFLVREAKAVTPQEFIEEPFILGVNPLWVWAIGIGAMIIIVLVIALIATREKPMQ